MILAIWMNGQIGFNERDTPLTSTTKIVELAESAWKANEKHFNHKAEVSTHAITMGIQIILNIPLQVHYIP